MKRFFVAAFALLPSLAFAQTVDLNGVWGAAALPPVARAGQSVRWLLPVGNGWRLTLTSDAEIAPAETGAPARFDPRLPPFPSWTAGLRIGATGELL